MNNILRINFDNIQKLGDFTSRRFVQTKWLEQFSIQTRTSHQTVRNSLTENLTNTRKITAS